MKHKNLGIEVVGEELKMQVDSKMKIDSKVGVKGVKEMQVNSKVKVDSKAKARGVKGRKTLKQSRNFIPKFVSTIAALSLCVSSAVANHPDNKWEIKGSNGGSSQSNHTGNGSDASHTTTITDLTDGIITTKNDADGRISSLIIKKETNNDKKPTLEVGNKADNNKIIVPKITIKEGATLNRTINGDSGNKWNIIFRGGSTIDNFENNGTIKSNSTADTVYLYTDGQNNGGQTVVKNFTNKGTIESTDNGAAVRLQNGAKIETFKNESGKLISATGSAVAIKVKEGSRNILGTFINEGTIKAEGKTDGSEGALQFYNTTITSFKNSGTIETSNANNNGGSSGSSSSTNNRSSRSIDLYKATITNFTNSGTIKASKNNAVYLNASTIETFINEGIIESESQGNNGSNNQNDGFKYGNAHLIHAAIRVQAGNGETSSIKNLENRGTLKGKRAGISIARQANDNGNSNNINIGTIKNTGTIEAGNAGIYMVSDFMTIQNIINEGKITITNGNGSPSNSNGDYSAGIVIAAVTHKKPIYGTIENKNKGTITGGDYGVFIEGGSISNLKNSGTIEGKKDGIAFFNAGGTLNTTINNLEIEGQGIIRGQDNGINISKTNGNSDQTVVGNLKIAQGATVEGVSGSGLVLGKDNKNGSSSNNTDTYKLTGKIQVDGTLKGKTAAITNKGQLGSSEGGDVLVIGEQGKIEGVVRNESGGTLKGNITNNGNGTLEIDNQGKTGNNTVIKNDGNGSIKILDWKLENQSNGSNGNLKTVQFEGNGNITLEKLTISETTTDITKVANAIQGSQKAQAVAHTQVQTSDGNGAVTITGDLLRGLVANIDGSKTAAAALNRTLIATATARATFLDTVMGNALNTLSFLHHRASSSLGSYKNANLYANATTIRNDLLSQSSSYA
ncbi:hypothetical protein, partial [Helicobacter sp. 10-6591]|uniref:hypothetical protein n=1 Tax=Helicobacter sp. 10-6591 TaxID=2004998 RepID=UPI0011BEEC48